MKYYRCRCGDHTAYGSMGPSPCSRCKTCGSNVTIPGHYQSPKPHRMVVEFVDTDEEAKPYTSCIWCGRSKKEIMERDEPMDFSEAPLAE